MIYEAFDLPKQSPTVGAYFFADDYIKFIQKLRYYITLEIKFITAKYARHREAIIRNGNLNCPIGVLDDVEIIFVHYKDANLVREKWNRRIERINWDNLIFKFSYMNDCTQTELRTFDEMELPGKKIMFVNTRDFAFKCGVYYPGFENERQIYNDTFYYDKYFDIFTFINEGRIIAKNI